MTTLWEQAFVLYEETGPYPLSVPSDPFMQLFPETPASHNESDNVQTYNSTTAMQWFHLSETLLLLKLN